MSIHKEITPEQIARIKLRYAARTIPVHDIAREEGVTPSRIYELRRRFGWPTRTEIGKQIVERMIEQDRAIAAAMAGQASSPVGHFLPGSMDCTEPLDAHALVARVQAELAREATAAEQWPPRRIAVASNDGRSGGVPGEAAREGGLAAGAGAQDQREGREK